MEWDLRPPISTLVNCLLKWNETSYLNSCKLPIDCAKWNGAHVKALVNCLLTVQFLECGRFSTWLNEVVYQACPILGKIYCKLMGYHACWLYHFGFPFNICTSFLCYLFYAVPHLKWVLNLAFNVFSFKFAFTKCFVFFVLLSRREKGSSGQSTGLYIV